MFTSKTLSSEKGLTLIELLITIAVLAIVTALAVPVITNVVSSSQTNAVAAMNTEVSNFVDQFTKSGTVTYDAGSQTFSGWVDLDGNGSYADPDEKVQTLEVDSRFSVADNGDGTYTVSSATGPAALATVYDGTDWTSASFQQDPSFATGSHIVVSGSSASMKSYESTVSPTTVTVSANSTTYVIPISSSGYDAGTDSLWFVFDGVIMDGNNLYGVSITQLDFSAN